MAAAVGVVDDDDDDDADDMADLFSFGVEEAAAASTNAPNTNATSTTSSSTSGHLPAGGGFAMNSGEVGGAIITGGGGGVSVSSSTSDVQTKVERSNSEDSFLEMLESQDSSVLRNHHHSPTSSPSNRSAAGGGGQGSKNFVVADEETLEILSWLEDDGKESSTTAASAADSTAPTDSAVVKTAATVTPSDGSPSAAASAPPPPATPTVVALPPLFKSLSEALQSDASTPSQIVQLAQQQLQQQQQNNLASAAATVVSSSPAVITRDERAQLYCRLLCGGKTLDQVQQSSLADSFVRYQKTQTDEEAVLVCGASCMDLATRVVQYLSSSSSLSSSSNTNNNKGDDNNNHQRTVESVAEELQLLLGFYFQKKHDTDEDDPLVPPVAAALLAVLPNAATASVVLRQIVAHRMPVLALEPPERWEACLLLHQELYLLACYHIPLLVFHLDRYLPGWYWPRPPPAPGSSVLLDDNISSTTTKGKEGPDAANNSSTSIPVAAKSSRQLQNQRGLLPQSWLLSHMAGECGNHSSDYYQYVSALSSHAAFCNSGLSLDLLLQLWDHTLVTVLPEKDSFAMRFFLVLAVLERAADELLLLTGDQLLQSFQRVTQLTATNANIHTTIPATTNNTEDSSDSAHPSPPVPVADDFYSWMNRAKQLQEWTPESVWIQLTSAEDRAVQQSLLRRQERAQKELQAKLDAEAEAHRLAQEQKANAARERLTRARLVAFYRKHAPDKESNIDKIMESYDGEFDVLDAKLKRKYGEGFNPPVAKKQQQPPQQQQQQQPSSPHTFYKNSNKLLSTMNTGLGVPRSSPTALSKEELEAGDNPDSSGPSEQVSVLVTASEVLPVICWTKEAAAARGQQRRRRLADKKQLKFYLVDSRSEEAALEQGRFPTAVRLSPEAMFDPVRLKENEEMFESLRGAVHIVVMGEGFAALPDLYGHKLTPKLEELMREDEARTNICALFFVKKGFPFVSVLNGGYAAAHAWLVRKGAAHHLTPSAVLVDYDPDASLFGQLESLRNATATEKAQRKMQNLLDKSLTAMTKRAQQLERLALDHESNNRDGSGIGSGVVRALFASRGPESSFTRLQSEEFAVADSPLPSDVTRPSITLPSSPSSATTTLPHLHRESSSKGVGVGEEKLKEGGADGEEGTSTIDLHDGGGGANTSNQNPNRFSMFRGAIPEAAPGTAAAAAAATAHQASNMFKGLGAAFNQSIKATDANVLKRNPFSRFGGGGGGAAPAAPSTTGSSSPATTRSATTAEGAGGGGWNPLRRVALAPTRSFDAEEESISFATRTPDSRSETSSGVSVVEGAATAAAPAPAAQPAAQVQMV